MYLTEVTLRNWRSYRAVRFGFPLPVGKQRVVLVGAMNGSGKTSLLMALYLGLFGREAMEHLEGVQLSTSEDEKIRSYKQLMERIIHRPALGEDEPRVEVGLAFTDGERSLNVNRVWRFTRGGRLLDLSNGDGEETRIEINGKLKAAADWKDANNRIADVLFPPFATPCFFFDGEQAQKRVEASGKLALSEAVDALYGTQALHSLGDSLRHYVANRRNQLRGEGLGNVRQDELAAKRVRKDELEEELGELEEKLREANRKLEAAETARRAKTAELTQIVGDTSVDLQQLSKRREDANIACGDLEKQVQDSVAALALPIALRRLGERLRARLEQEIEFDRWVVLKDETQRKAEEICHKALPEPGDTRVNPPLTGSQHLQLTGRLQQALESLWNPPPIGWTGEFHLRFLGMSERSALLSQTKQIEQQGVRDVGDLARRWDDAQRKRIDLNRQWERAIDFKPKLEELKKQLGELDAQAKQLTAEKTTLDNRNHALQRELHDLKAAIGQMEGIKLRLDPAGRKLDTAERVREVIVDVREALIARCQEHLAELCTRHFREMNSREYRNYHIRFDAEMQPFLEASGMPPVYVATLSGAQRRAFGLAFTLAVAEASGATAPVVVDTPVGNMDSEFRGRILTYLAKNAAGQVILLSHDEEIYGQYVEQLAPFTRKKFLVEFEQVGEGAGVSTVVENRYFGS